MGEEKSPVTLEEKSERENTPRVELKLREGLVEQPQSALLASEESEERVVRNAHDDELALTDKPTPMQRVQVVECSTVAEDVEEPETESGEDFVSESFPGSGKMFQLKEDGKLGQQRQIEIDERWQTQNTELKEGAGIQDHDQDQVERDEEKKEAEGLPREDQERKEEVEEEEKDVVVEKKEAEEKIFISELPQKICCEPSCKNPAEKVCARCQNSSYCSKPCQVMHWRQGGHREACVEFSKAN